MYSVGKSISSKRRWVVSVGGVFALVVLMISPASAGLFITEYMADADVVSDTLGEYLEVYNTGPAIAVASLTIADSEDIPVSFTMSTAVIGMNEFFVFGHESQDYVDQAWDLAGFLSNGIDRIRIRQNGEIIAEVNYTDGDHFGDGVAHELVNIDRGAITTGPTLGSDYVASILEFDVLDSADIGSPGSAGLTVIPEPSGLVSVIVVLLLSFKRWVAELPSLSEYHRSN